MVPSTKQTLKYRPFLVKEEKILLLAQQGGTANDLIRAINQIIEACVEDVDVNKLASFDTEYIFLQLRANSVSELAKINIQDEEIDDWVEVEVDLHDVIVPEIEMDNKVELADDIFIELRYPRYVDMMRLDEDDELNTNIEMIAMCIDKVYEGEEVMEMSSFSKEEQEVFINSFSADAFAKVQEFFVNMPKVSMEAKYKIKVDGKSKTKKRKLEGINDFF